MATPPQINFGLTLVYNFMECNNSNSLIYGLWEFIKVCILDRYYRTVNIVVCASSGPVLERCRQYRSNTGPVLAFYKRIQDVIS